MADETRYRMTKQRTVILDILRKMDTHPTADEIYEKVRTKMPRISLGTVYRNLEFLCEQGMVTLLDIGGSQRRYECVGEMHYHVRCLGCGKVEDLNFVLDTSLEETIKSNCDFEIIAHHLEFIGYCHMCRSNEGDPEK